MAPILVNGMDIGYLRIHLYMTADSSVGRAGDCRCIEKAVISRSLVQIRLGGCFPFHPYCIVSCFSPLEFNIRVLIITNIVSKS